MTMLDSIRGATGSRGSLVALVALLVASAALSKLPPNTAENLCVQARDWLRPGQRMAQSATRIATDWAAAIRVTPRAAKESVRLARENTELERANARLSRTVANLLAQQKTADKASLRGLEDGQVPSRTTDASQPLLVAHGVRVGVLGRQARAYLRALTVLDVEQHSGLTPDAIVLESPQVEIDAGLSQRVASGQMALVGGTVWGRVVAVGQHTATVCRIDQPGYRDVVSIARADDDAQSPVARGVLEGTGESLCRVTHVAADAGVRAGDVVLLAGETELPGPLPLCGYVESVIPGSDPGNCELRVRPAVANTAPDSLIVVRLDRNPDRPASDSVADADDSAHARDTR